MAIGSWSGSGNWTPKPGDVGKSITVTVSADTEGFITIGGLTVHCGEGAGSVSSSFICTGAATLSYYYEWFNKSGPGHFTVTVGGNALVSEPEDEETWENEGETYERQDFYDETEHSKCTEVGAHETHPWQGGTRKTSRYLRHHWKVPGYTTYQKQRSNKGNVREIVVGTRLAKGEKTEVADAGGGVNVSYTSSRNATPNVLTHVLYTCAECGFRLTQEQEAMPDWELVGEEDVATGTTRVHHHCEDLGGGARRVGSFGGTLSAVVREWFEETMTWAHVAHYRNADGDEMSETTSTWTGTPTVVAGATRTVSVSVGANMTQSVRTVVIYTCAKCGLVIEGEQDAASAAPVAPPGPGEEPDPDSPYSPVVVEPTEPPGPLPVEPLPEHTCAGGIYHGEEPMEDAAAGDSDGGARVVEAVKVWDGVGHRNAV